MQLSATKRYIECHLPELRTAFQTFVHVAVVEDNTHGGFHFHILSTACSSAPT